MEKGDCRIRSLGWFLTYPKCPAPKEHLMSFLQTFPNYIGAVVAQEHHKDGSLHLHAFAKYRTRLTLKASTFDFLYEAQSYHGNYQTAKSPKHVIRVSTKPAPSLEGQGLSLRLGQVGVGVKKISQPHF